MAAILLYNAHRIFTAAGGPRRGPALTEATFADGDALLIVDGKVAALGPRDVTGKLAPRETTAIDCGGRLVTPGFVDCHTHLVYAGSRAAEYERRLAGESYLEIMVKGGGILTTVAATRAATDDELFDAARRRAEVMLADGTTTAEVKSGYGLTLESELKILRVAKRIGQETPLETVPTFMGAHALPVEYAHRREAFVAHVNEVMIPAVSAAGLAEYADVFCDRGAFTKDEAAAVLAAARRYGLGLRIHADEFESVGAAELAVALGAASADHLTVTRDTAIAALAASSTVAVLLPGTSVFLGSTKFAPARALINAGAIVAVASDHNPGSCHAASLLTVLTPAASYLKMQPVELLHAVTVNAAYSVGRADRLGSLEVGKQGDVVVFNAETPADIFYDWGGPKTWLVIKRGEIVGGLGSAGL